MGKSTKGAGAGGAGVRAGGKREKYQKRLKVVGSKVPAGWGVIEGTTHQAPTPLHHTPGAIAA